MYIKAYQIVKPKSQPANIEKQSVGVCLHMFIVCFINGLCCPCLRWCLFYLVINFEHVRKKLYSIHRFYSECVGSLYILYGTLMSCVLYLGSQYLVMSPPDYKWTWNRCTLCIPGVNRVSFYCKVIPDHPLVTWWCLLAVCLWCGTCLLLVWSL